MAGVDVKADTGIAGRQVLQPRQTLGLAADHHLDLQPAQHGLQKVEDAAGDPLQVHQPERHQQPPRLRLRTPCAERAAPHLRVGGRQQGIGGSRQDDGARRRQRRIVQSLAAQRGVDQQAAPMRPVGEIVDHRQGRAQEALLVGAQLVMVHHYRIRAPRRRRLAGGVDQAVQRPLCERQTFQPAICERVQHGPGRGCRDHGAGRTEIQQRPGQRQAAHDVAASDRRAEISQEEDPASGRFGLGWTHRHLCWHKRPNHA